MNRRFGLLALLLCLGCQALSSAPDGGVISGNEARCLEMSEGASVTFARHQCPGTLRVTLSNQCAEALEVRFSSTPSAGVACVPSVPDELRRAVLLDAGESKTVGIAVSLADLSNDACHSSMAFSWTSPSGAGERRLEISGRADVRPVVDSYRVPGVQWDIVVGIQGSGSLREQRAMLLAQFQALLDGFETHHEDYRLAFAVSADADSYLARGADGSVYVDPSTPDRDEALAVLIDTVLAGSTSESVSLSVGRALARDAVGFVRQGETLAVVLVADAADPSAVDIDAIGESLEQLGAPGTDFRPMLVAPEGSADGGGCPGVRDQDLADWVWRHSMPVVDLCSDWALLRYSLMTAHDLQAYRMDLTQNADPQYQVSVTVDDTPLPRLMSDGGAAWSMNEYPFRINFHPDAAPGPNQTLAVTYVPQSSCLRE